MFKGLAHCGIVVAVVPYAILARALASEETTAEAATTDSKADFILSPESFITRDNWKRRIDNARKRSEQARKNGSSTRLRTRLLMNRSKNCDLRRAQRLYAAAGRYRFDGQGLAQFAAGQERTGRPHNLSPSRHVDRSPRQIADA